MDSKASQFEGNFRISHSPSSCTTCNSLMGKRKKRAPNPVLKSAPQDHVEHDDFACFATCCVVDTVRKLNDFKDTLTLVVSPAAVCVVASGGILVRAGKELTSREEDVWTVVIGARLVHQSSPPANFGPNLEFRIAWAECPHTPA